MKLYEKVRQGIGKVKNDGGVPIPITSKMINDQVKKTDNLKETSVEIKNGLLVVKGIAEVEKMFFKKDVSFTVTLRPVSMVKREMIFEIEQFKPVNLEFLNKKIFNKQPHMHYNDGHIKIDFNSWDIVSKVSIGQIKKYQMMDEKIVLTIGL